MAQDDADARAAADFEAMMQRAAREVHVVSGADVALKQARSGRHALLAAAVLFTLTAPVFGHVHFSDFSTTFGITAAASFLICAGLFVVLFFRVQHDPLKSLVVAFVLYCLMMLPSALFLMGSVGLEVWLLHLVVFIAMIDALRAAIHHRRLVKKAELEAENAVNG